MINSTKVSNCMTVTNTAGVNNLKKRWPVLIQRWLFLLLMAGTVGVNAQSTANYTPTTGTTGSLAADLNSNVVDFTTGATSLVAAGLDDTQSALTSIGFDFYFLGVRYTQFSATDNGLIGMGAQPGTSVYSIPNGTIPVISAFANDMRVGTNGIVRSKVVGTAPNRCLVVEWSNNMIRYLATAAAGTATFQVRLYETTGLIEYVYGTMATNAASPTAYYVGFSNNTTATKVLTVNTTANTVNTTATVTSNSYTASSTITALNSTANGSRKFYRFTPLITSAPTNLTFTNVLQTTLTLNWVNNGSNRLATAIYNSTDNVTFTYLGQAAAAATSINITGLAPGTTYYFRLYSVSEGYTGAPLTGSQATTVVVPLTGIKTIDNTLPNTGNNFSSFTNAITSLNSNGVGAGGVIFNVTSGQTFSEYSLFVTVTGTAANPVIFQKSGAGANPIISATGAASTETAVGIVGADYITFDGINVTASGALLEYGYYVQNGSATDGAQNNTIKNCTVTLNRANTACVTIIQLINVAPTSATGANSNNKYYNLTVKNATTGILLQGNTSFPDLNTEVGTTSCAIRNTIGDPATADDILYAGAAGGFTYGIKATNQGSVKIFNNDISNITSSINNSVVDGIFIDNSAATVVLGTSDIYNNKITGISNTGAGTNVATFVRGIRANGNTVAGTITRIYNNFISNLQTGNLATTGRRIQGISLQPAGSGAGSSINCDFNSVRIAANNLIAINTCFEIGTASGPIFRVRNNIFANLTGLQTGTAKHYTWVTTSATSIGAAGSLSNYNDLYVTGANGFVGLGNATDYATLANWQTATSNDGNSVSTDPVFTSATDLHMNAVALDGAADPAYATNTPWVTVDIDCTTRPAATDIGADEVSFATCTGAVGGTAVGNATFCVSGTPTITASGYSSGTNTAYQWEYSNDNFVADVHDFVGQTNPATLTTGVVSTTTYYRLRVTCPAGVTTDYSNTITVTINPAPAAVAVSGAGTFCGTATLTASNGNDGTIYFQGTTSNGTSTATPSVSQAVTVSGTYYFRALSAAGCWGAQGSAAVVINAVPATPTVTPATATAICLGTSQALTASSAAVPINILTQNFNAGLGSWTVSNGTGHTAGTEWLIKTPPYTYAALIVNSNGFDGSNFIVANSDLSGAVANLTVTRLVSPVFSTSGRTGVTINFAHFLRALNETFVGVEYTINGGSTWTAVTGGTYTGTSTTGASGTQPPFANVSLTLNAAALNQPAVQIRFRYDASYDYYWGIDNITVNGLTAPQYSWTASPATDAGLPATAGTPLTTNSSITATPTATGSYTYSAIATNPSTGCTSAEGTTGLVTVNPNFNAGTVSGTSPLCIGATATYTTTGDAGGTWSSSDPSVATVDANTGVVTAIGTGNANITYTINNVCSNQLSAFKAVEVLKNVYAGIISGTSPLCPGITATYSTDGDPDGTWSSTNPAVATVDANTGVVTAIAQGTSNITYTISTGCGAPASAFKTLTVSANANAGTVTGASPLCIGATAVYSSDGNAGGSWSSSNTGIATVDPVTGLVTGIAQGTASIIYTVGTGCNAPVSASQPVTVQAIDYANLQFPGSATICSNGSLTAYGQVYEAGVTEAPGQGAGITVEIGYNTSNTNPATWTNWSPATFNVQVGNNDEYMGTVGNGFLPGTYYYTFRYSFTGCTSYQYGGYSSGGGNFWDGTTYVSGVLTVSPDANAGTVTGTSPLCIGATATYSSTGDAGGTWSSTNASVATVNANTGVVTALSAGTTDITYTVTTGCNAPQSSFQTLTVDANANAGTVTGTSPLCIGATATYSSTGDAGGTWSSTNASVATVNANTGVVTALSAGTTDITYTVTTGCNAPQSAFQTLTVDANANAGTVTGTSPLCIGATATYSSTGDASGTWSSTNTSVATVNANTGVVTALSAGTTDITYTVTTGCNAPQSAFQTLTVDPNANAGTVTGTSPLCIGATATYSSTGDAGGTWSSTNASVATVNATTGVVTALSAGTTDITYTVTTGCNAPQSAFQTLTVDANANAGTVTGTSPLCIGATATYSTTGDAGGTWSSTNASVATVNANTGVVTALSAGTTDITYTVTAGCNAPQSAFQTLTVDANANAGTVTGTSPLCIGATATYSSTGDAGGTWSSTNASVATVNANTGVVTALSAGTTDITYTVTTGCNAPVSAFQTLIVSPNVNAGTVSGPTPLIAGNTGQYSTTGDAGGTWSSTNTGVATVDANTGLVTAVAAGTTDITYTISSGCGAPASAFQTLTVEVNAFTITSGAGANGSISPNGVTTVASGGNQSYTITPNTCYHVDNVLVDGSSVGAVTSYTFTNVTANHTISATFALNAPLPAPGPLSGPINACPYVGTGEQVTYSVPALQGATSYSWIVPPTVTIVSGQGTNSITVTFSAGFTAGANKQLRVTALSSCGNSPQATFILVAQLPGTPKPIIASSSNVCAVIGTSGTITYTIPKVTAATSYSWITQAGTTAVSHPNGLGVNDTVVTVSFTNGFTTSAITVQAVNECGTTAARSLTITRNNPATPGPITGPSNACPYIAPNGTAAAYSVNAVANATSYTWTIPANSTGLTGQGTPSISFTYPAGFTSGSVSVTTTNGCGTSGARTLSITKLNPATPGVIDVVQNSACPNRSYSYTISALPSNATSIQWTVPSGATLVSGQGTTSITVSYPATAVSGAVTAQAVNNCGVSVIRSSTVKLPSCAVERPVNFTKGMAEPVVNEEAVEAMSVNVFPNPSVTDFKLQVITAGKEKIEVRILDLQGRQLQKINVMAYQTISIGNELKAGSYMIEVRQGKEVKTTRVIKF